MSRHLRQDRRPTKEIVRDRQIQIAGIRPTSLATPLDPHFIKLRKHYQKSRLPLQNPLWKRWRYWKRKGPSRTDCTPQLIVQIRHGWEASARKYPRCWDTPIDKKSAEANHDSLGRKQTGGGAAISTNPKKSRADKRKIKYADLLSYMKTVGNNMHECMYPDEPQIGL